MKGKQEDMSPEDLTFKEWLKKVLSTEKKWSQKTSGPWEEVKVSMTIKHNRLFK